ncbi:MAG: 16S rRNA (guanine(527)-N(7))-methyltransferase RsmG [Pseudomonadales bacterium]
MPASSSPASVLAQGLEKLPLKITNNDSERLLHYIELLAHWNRKHNLTAVRDVQEMVPLHLLDSLAILPFLPPGRLLDLGSGAGLPGIPLAIAQPGREIVLLDASFKRVVFLREVIRKLALPNVQALHARAEQASLPAFDVITTRGFASLCKTIEQSEHLLSPKGFWVAMKGRYPGKELAELGQRDNSRGYLHRIEPLLVPGLDAERHILLIGKQP